MNHTVLGAGPLGVAIAETLSAAGEQTSLLSVMGNPAYDMPGTTPTAIDGTDPSHLRRACEGADVIYLCLNAHYVDWSRLFPPRLDAAISAAAAVGAKLVYHDNVYCYGEATGSLTEETPTRATTRKGRLRAEMAEVFLDAARSGIIEGVIGRSADMYGPGALNSSFNSTLGERHFKPLLAGKPVTVIGNVDLAHTYTSVRDAAQGLVTLGRHRAALGQVWHLPAAPTLTHRELLTEAFEVANLTPKIRASRFSGLFVRAVGRFQHDVGEVAEILYQFEQPLVVTHTRFEAAFGAAPTPHHLALAETLDWYRHSLQPDTRGHSIGGAASQGTQ